MKKYLVTVSQSSVHFVRDKRDYYGLHHSALLAGYTLSTRMNVVVSSATQSPSQSPHYACPAERETRDSSLEGRGGGGGDFVLCGFNCASVRGTYQSRSQSPRYPCPAATWGLSATTPTKATQ